MRILKIIYYLVKKIVYRLNNGDIIKLLPILKDGTLVPIIERILF
jgi:hypothetical protein